jgi:hypothetical protein
MPLLIIAILALVLLYAVSKLLPMTLLAAVVAIGARPHIPRGRRA